MRTVPLLLLAGQLILGLRWLLHLFHPGAVQGDLRREVRDFYRLYYHVDLDDSALSDLMLPPLR